MIIRWFGYGVPRLIIFLVLAVPLAALYVILSVVVSLGDAVGRKIALAWRWAPRRPLPS